MTIRLENMAGARCSVWASHDHVRMDHRFSLIERDIATHPNHLVLTMDGNLLVHFALGMEGFQGRSTQRSNRGEMRARNLILFRNSSSPEKASSPW